MWIAVAVAALAVFAAAFVWFTRPPAVPVVEAVNQLTDDAVPKRGPLLTDGARIYFNEGATVSWKIAQVSTAGGETSILSTRLANAELIGLAPDGSSLVVSNPASDRGPGALWTIPLPTGEPRRLGNMEVAQAGLFPDGRVVFTQGSGLYIAEKDGSNTRRLLSTADQPVCPQVSPGGEQIVFLRTPLIGVRNALVGVATDGSATREILRDQPEGRVLCAVWSVDGSYLMYRVYHSGRSDIWLLPVRSKFSLTSTKPIQLTNGPLSYSGLAQSRDGRLFAIGTKRRGELVQYDVASGKFTPFLSGISATDPTFSSDGKWVAYISYPEHTLWRSRADGTDRLQLTYFPMEVQFPVISPDGRQVSFRTSEDELYIVGMDGGPLRKIEVKNAFSGTLSPDRNSMVLTVWVEGKHLGDRNATQLRILDLLSGAVSDVPSSQGIGGAFWMNQETLVGVSELKILAFDLRAKKWEELASGHINNWMPSPDGKYLYYSTGGTDPEAFRLRVADHHVERITSLKNLRRVVDTVGTQISVAPEGSPVFTRDIGTQEIYALTVKWP